jgi:fumarylacetoacetate (FAA) hydrolase
MKLGTLRRGGRDGILVVVSRDLARAVAVPSIAPTLQRALDSWSDLCEQLGKVSDDLNAGRIDDAFELRVADLAAPLPRAFQWLDGSAYLNHVELVRRARGASLPPSVQTEPVMYQGGSDTMLGPLDPISVADESWSADLEAEIAVITDDVPMACTRAQAAEAIRLLVLVNDISLRGLIPAELAKGFGFLHGKPSTAFAPVAVTPDELGGAWDGCKANLELTVELNGEHFGSPNAGVDMHFDFLQLIVHAAKTRALSAGTIIGAGTVSNRDQRAGSCCIAERRAIEMIERDEPLTPYLRHGDRVRIEVRDRAARSVFGAIDQRVER